MVDILTLGDGSTLPRLAFDSVLDAATLTSAASTEADGALEQCTDWKCYTFWRPTGGGPFTITADLGGAKTVNAFAIAGHDAAGLTGMDYWNGSAWVVFAEVIAAGDGAPLYLFGDAVLTTKLRFRFTTLSFLCILYAGEDLVLAEGVESGWEDPVMAQRATIYPESSRDGVYLGSAVIEWNATLQLDVKNVDQAWARDEWTPFVRKCTTQPFFLHWHPVDWPASAAFCTMAKFGKAAFSQNEFINLSVSFDADVGLDRRMSP